MRDDHPPEAGISWNVGDRVADMYEVRGVLGRGAMGLVYRVRHLGWDIDLAVKSPHAELFHDDADKELFVEEAETWVSLGMHPNMCGCHYVRTLGGIPRVFAECVDGGSVRDWIHDRRLYQGGPQEALARVLDLTIQTAWGLEHAHTHGVVHQDVKPANILVDGEGTAKVTDFGLARSRQRGTGPGVVAPGGDTILVTTGGMTPAYASPEQVAGRQLGRRSDVGSFAVSMLEMFTGGVTWVAGPMAGMVLAACRERGTGEGLAVRMPETVAEVLASCLRDDPASRPGSMGEVAARLEEIYRHQIGRRYDRVPPKAAELRADELNNREREDRSVEQLLALVTAVAGAVTAIFAARAEVLKYRREAQLSGQGAGAVRVWRPWDDNQANTTAAHGSRLSRHQRGPLEGFAVTAHGLPVVP